MFYMAELECEIRAQPIRLQWSFRILDDDREEHIKEILDGMKDKCYDHTPADGCSERGLKSDCNYI